MNESSAKQGQRTTSTTSKDVRRHENKNKRNKLFWLKSPPREEGRQLERRKLTITRSIANLKNASNRKVRTFSPIIFEEKDGGIYDFIHLIASHYSPLAHPLITPIPFYSLLSTLTPLPFANGISCFSVLFFLCTARYLLVQRPRSPTEKSLPTFTMSSRRRAKIPQTKAPMMILRERNMYL